MVTIGYCRHRPGRRSDGDEHRNGRRTAVRQAGAIVAVSGQRSVRPLLGLAHDLYDALVLLEPKDRARRIRLIDAIFGAPARDAEHRHGQP